MQTDSKLMIHGSLLLVCVAIFAISLWLWLTEGEENFLIGIFMIVAIVSGIASAFFLSSSIYLIMKLRKIDEIAIDGEEVARQLALKREQERFK